MKEQHTHQLLSNSKKLRFESSFHNLNKQYTELIDSLLQRIHFLEEERGILLGQCATLKQKLKRFETNHSIQICMDDPSKTDDSLLFEEVSELTESNSYSHDSSPIRNIGNSPQFDFLLTQNKQSAKLNDLLSNAKTPELNKPPFKNYYYRSHFCLKGLIRAFYIKILTLPECVTSLIQIIETEYKQNNYQKIYLFSKYPDNMIIGDLMISFLNEVSEMTKFNQLIRRITQFKLYDDILCQLLLNKLQVYVNLAQYFDQKAACKCFKGLAQIFELTFIAEKDKFKFYPQIQNKKRLNSQDSDYVSKIQEEISFNPGNNEENKQNVQINNLEPIFTIEYNAQTNKFQFVIKQELSISQCQSFTEHKQVYRAKQFFDNSELVKSKTKEYNYFLQIKEQLFQQKLSSSQQSRKQFRQAIQKYNKNRYGSHQSSMLLSSNNSLRYSKELQKENRRYNQGNSNNKCEVVHQSIQQFDF